MIRNGYKSKHWTDGGTGVTNFGTEEMPAYERAVTAFGDERIFLSDVRMSDSPLQVCGSLHCSDTALLPEFWRLFERMTDTANPATTEG